MNQIKLKKQYRPYPQYRDSGVEWLGMIPKNWEERKLKYIAQINKNTLTETTKAEFVMKYIDIGNVDHNGVKSCPESLEFQNAPSRARRIVKKGNTIIGTVRTYLKALAFFHNPDTNLIVSTGFAVLEPTKKVADKFLYYCVLSESFIQHISKWSSGVSYPAINPSDLGNLPICFPEIEKQQRIIANLDEKTAIIDKIIEKKQKLIELLAEKQSALINLVVTRGIVENLELKESGVEWIGKVPRNWKIDKLKRIGRSIIGLTYSPEDVVNESGTLVLRSSNIQNGKILLKDNVYVSKKIPEKLKTRTGDILICSRNGSRALIGKNACIDTQSSGLSFGAFMTIFRSKYWRFLSYVFKSSMFNGQSESFLTSTINQLTIDNLNNMVVVLPDTLAEQEKIIEYLELETKKITYASEEVEKSIGFLKEYKTSLISSVITGKIKIMTQ